MKFIPILSRDNSYHEASSTLELNENFVYFETSLFFLKKERIPHCSEIDMLAVKALAYSTTQYFTLFLFSSVSN